MVINKLSFGWIDLIHKLEHTTGHIGDATGRSSQLTNEPASQPADRVDSAEQQLLYTLFLDCQRTERLADTFGRPNMVCVRASERATKSLFGEVDAAATLESTMLINDWSPGMEMISWSSLCKIGGVLWSAKQHARRSAGLVIPGFVD